MKKHKIKEENYKIIETGLLAKEGMAIVEDLIYKQDLPDAFFCVSNPVAMGVIKTLKDNGYNVPRDIAVMGFTDTQMAELISPQLCSVKQPTFEMGKIAANLLLDQINNDKTNEPITKLLNGKLIIRESSIKTSST